MDPGVSSVRRGLRFAEPGLVFPAPFRPKDCIEKPPAHRTLLRFTVENPPVSKLSFEDALAQLETIVDSMEAGEVPLADLLAKFEEGNKLLKVCEARLKDAELKIEQLKKQKDSSVAFTPFESDRNA